MRARAPAKTILSGEHAVVYGMPALALALPRYAQVDIAPCSDLVTSACLRLHLCDLERVTELDPVQLAALKQQIERRYQHFLECQLTISDVLVQATDLFTYALSLCPEVLKALSGCQIQLQSEIAIGSGMGSSAATVAALLQAVFDWAQLALTRERLVELVTRCEQLQHGRSSGLDPAICVSGGLIRFQQGQVEPVAISLDRHWYLVNSGQPQDSTGRCTSQVRQHFSDSDIWQQFAQTTRALEQALVEQNSPQIIEQLKRNHRLLCQIGVVPASVQAWVTQVEQQGGAAKISGAGAISGDQAGQLLVYLPQSGSTWLSQQPWPWQQMEMDEDGTRRD